MTSFDKRWLIAGLAVALLLEPALDFAEVVLFPRAWRSR